MNTFDNNYIVIDLETTGFCRNKDQIIEIGALVVSDGVVTDKIDMLIDPKIKIPPEITSLTGISDSMLYGQPKLQEVLPAFVSRINHHTILGHNIPFDIGFLREACSKLGLELNCTYIDTLDVSRKTLPGLPSYSLEVICKALEITNEHSHRALSDCLATHECYQKMMHIAQSGEPFIAPAIDITPKNKRRIKGQYYTDETISLQKLEGILIGITCDDVLTEDEVYSLKAWLDENRHLCGNYPFDRAEKAISAALEDGILEQHELDEMLTVFKELICPDFSSKEDNEVIDIKGKSICVTGEFKKGPREEISAELEKAGAIIKSAVSGKLDYLIVGGLGSDAWKHGNYGGKIKKAMELKEQGKNITIISEEDFFKSFSTLIIV